MSSHSELVSALKIKEFFLYDSILKEFCAIIEVLTNAQKASLKGLHATLLISTRTLQGASFLENA